MQRLIRRAPLTRRWPSLLGSGLLMLLLAACGTGTGDGSPPPADEVISGSVVVPQGHDVNGTVVTACSDMECLQITINDAGREATFSFTELDEAEYVVSALKLLGESGFLAGCFTTGADSCTAITPPHENTDIALELVGGPPSPPTPPPSE